MADDLVAYIPDYSVPDDVPSLRFHAQGEYQRISEGFGQTRDQINGRVNWASQWAPGEYAFNDMVRDGQWTMVCINPQGTSDRAAPLATAPPEFSQPDNQTFATQTQSAVILSGQEYTFSEGGYVQLARVWVPSVGATLAHRLIVTINPDTDPIATIYPLSGLTGGQWDEVQIGALIVSPGEKVSFVLETVNTAAAADYVDATGFFAIDPSWASVDGVLSFDGTPQPSTNDAFGVDIEFTEADVSPDWDVAAFGGESGSSQTGTSWGTITGDITLQTDMQDEFINKSGDTWDQGAVQLFPKNPASVDTTDAEMAFIDFFGINAFQIQAATANTNLGIGYLLLTDRQGEAFPFIVGSKYDGWRVRNQLFTDPDAILTVAEGDNRYAGGATTWGNIIGNIDDQTDMVAKFFDVDGDTWSSGAVQTFSPPLTLPSSPNLLMEYADFLGVNGLFFQPSSGTCGYFFNTGSITLGANNSDGWEISGQVNNSANSIMTRGLSDGRFVSLTASQTVFGSKLFDAQTTIGGGLSGGLIVTGTGAGFGIDAAGIVLARGGFNAFNERVSAVADPQADTDALNRQSGDGRYVSLTAPQTVNGEKLFDAQTTIGGGISGGLIVTGTGAGFGIDSTGVIYGRAGFNANNQLITNVANATAGHHAVSRNYGDGRYLSIGGTASDSNLLQNKNGAFYRNASNINAGTLAWQRLPSLIDQQTTIGGGTAGGLIVTGSGAGVSIDATGVILGRLGFNSNNQRVQFVGSPVSANDATNKTYVDGLDSANVKTSGNQSVFGQKTWQNFNQFNANVTFAGATNFFSNGANFNNARVTNVGTPTSGPDATNKTYVDAAVSDPAAKVFIDQIIDSSVIHRLKIRAFSYDYDVLGDLAFKPCFREGVHYGVNAKEAAQVLPEAIYDSPIEGLKSFDYDMLVPLLVKEVQQMRKEIVQLKQKVEGA